eukprot:2789683-Rhodomonas_salina.3
MLYCVTLKVAMLLRIRYAMFGSNNCYVVAVCYAATHALGTAMAYTLRSPVLKSATLLRICSAMSGTAAAMLLRLRYALFGTEIGYAATRMTGTEIGYGPTRIIGTETSYAATRITWWMACYLTCALPYGITLRLRTVRLSYCAFAMRCPGMLLRARYAVASTDIGYAATRRAREKRESDSFGLQFFGSTDG